VAVEIQSWREHLQHAEPSSSLTRLCIVLYQVDGAGEWDVTRFWPAMFLRVGFFYVHSFNDVILSLFSKLGHALKQHTSTSITLVAR